MINTIMNKLGWIKKSTVEKTLFTLQNQLEDAKNHANKFFLQVRKMQHDIELSKQAVKNPTKKTAKKLVIKAVKKTK